MGNNSSRTVNSVKNIATGFLGQFIQTFLGFISRTVFIKCLAAEYLGVSGLFTNILSVLSLAELGVGSAIIYALYKPLSEKDEEKISALMNFYAKTYKIIGLVIIFVGLILTPFLNYLIKDVPNISESIYVIFFFYLFNTAITYFFSYKNSIITADQKNYIALMINYVIAIVQTLLQIGVLIITKNFIAYLLVQSICSLMYNIIISRTADKLYPFLKKNKKKELDKKYRKELVINIKALMIVKLSGVLVNNTDNIIITYFSGLSAVGLCSNYTMLIGIISTILNQIFNGITASVGNLNAKESKEKQKYFFDIINFANFWLYAFAAIGIIIMSNDIIKVWIGEKFILPTYIPIILAVNFYMVGMQNAVWTYKNTLGLFRYGKYILLFTAAINLSLSMVLGKYIGLFGILLATAISRGLTNAWYDPYAVFKYGLNVRVKEYFIKYIKFISILLIALVSTFCITNFIEVTGIITLILKLILCVIVPNGIFIIIFFKTKEFKYFKDITTQLVRKVNLIKTKINV